MRVLLWHVHGAWTTAFVQGDHRYLIPTLPGRGPDGRGRAETYQWPSSAVEITPEQATESEIDVVMLQRPHELNGMAQQWLGGRQPGRDIPAIYLEHTTPQGQIAYMRHPAADRPDLTLVHVTHFNELFWDSGSTPTRVIEHGIVDPGYRYTGELERSAIVVNEARRRGRVCGTDLFSRFASAAPVDLFGIDAAALGGYEDIQQDQLHLEMAQRRVYVHPYRWTSLGLSMIEAMHLGMPIVAVATTEVPEVLPREAGVASTRLETLTEAVGGYMQDIELAQTAGEAARRAALERYNLKRFLADWDQVLEEIAR